MDLVLAEIQNEAWVVWSNKRLVVVGRSVEGYFQETVEVNAFFLLLLSIQCFRF